MSCQPITTPMLTDLLLTLSEISLKYQDHVSAVQRITEIGRQIMGSAVCTFTLVNPKRRTLTTIACSGCAPEYAQHVLQQDFRLGSSDRGDWLDYERLISGSLLELYHLQEDGQGIANPFVARRYRLDSALCCPVTWETELLGYFNHFSSDNTPFSPVDKQMIRLFARQAAVTMKVVDSLSKATTHAQLARLNQIMSALTAERSVARLLERMLESGLELIGSTRGWISRLDYDSGKLAIVAHRGNPAKTLQLEIGQGITGWALEQGRPVRVGDVQGSDWVKHYVEFWPDTRSELAVPIMVGNAEVRVGYQVQHAPKAIGVFNIESPDSNAFSRVHEDALVSLASHAALLIDRLDLDQKLAGLSKIQQDMVGVRNWDSVIDIMINAITNTLGFGYVNISLVDREHNTIKTEYIVGPPPAQVEEFKRLAKHSLDSDDIQAHIVRTGQVEVPPIEDQRFDQTIFRKFGHENLIRVYIPMVAPSNNQVIGTVEAGYLRQHRGHIYEQDVQVLKGFVDYAVRALEQRQRGLLDKISHELLNPIVGIRNNASFLQRRFKDLDDDKIGRKCDDILMDCETLVHQVEEFGYILGRPRRGPQIEKTYIFRDVIVKNVLLLKPLVSAMGFDPDRISYDSADIHKISPLYVDKTEINRVVYNLLINAIKYARIDPSKFTVRISVDRRRDNFVISIKDWGIGIQPQYTEKVFEEGFRTAEAIRRDVTGTGLGLTIARKIMRDLGGDLLLVNPMYPTEFQMVLPRTLTEERHVTDS